MVHAAEGANIDAAAVRRDLATITALLARALPHARIASYASTGDRAFVSADGRTTFMLVYPPPGPSSSFGTNPTGGQGGRAALHGVTVAGAPVHLTGLDALSSSSKQKGGLGLLLESLLGGVLALAVLAFVFASALAVVPLVIARDLDHDQLPARLGADLGHLGVGDRGAS